ncbi:MAG: Coq4 family protein [Acidimicrobiia bacterium]
MTLMIDPGMVEPVTRALLGAIDVDGGATDEQLAVLRAVVTHLWARDDLDLSTLTPLDPDAAASAIVDDAHRRLSMELMVTLELCRHPESAEQIDRVETYARALGASGPELEIFRSWIDEGTTRATADFDRFYGEKLEALSEPSLRHDYLRLEEPDLDLAQRLAALHDLPEGTLGHAYIEFYRRNGITVPGKDVHTPAHYVSHDMNHVISGYEPTGQEEIALGAFTLAMNDNDANWIQFIANLAIHEAGIIRHGEIVPKSSTLQRPGATDLLGEALWRGAQCTADFSQADHLVMADWLLDDVRAHFGVPAGPMSSTNP